MHRVGCGVRSQTRGLLCIPVMFSFVPVVSLLFHCLSFAFPPEVSSALLSDSRILRLVFYHHSEPQRELVLPTASARAKTGGAAFNGVRSGHALSRCASRGDRNSFDFCCVWPRGVCVLGPTKNLRVCTQVSSSQRQNPRPPIYHRL